jgi:hypothetical protein
MDERIEPLFSELSDMNVEASKVASETWRLVAEYEQQFRHNKVQLGYEDAAAYLSGVDRRTGGETNGCGKKRGRHRCRRPMEDRTQRHRGS